MPAWIVIDRRHHRKAAPYRHVTKNTSPQLLLFLTLTNCDACNPFRIRSYENCRGVYQQFPFWFASKPAVGNSSLTPVARPCIQVLSFHTLAHSFALFCTHAKLNPFLFKRFRTLCQKPPGWGEGHLLTSSSSSPSVACAPIRSGCLRIKLSDSVTGACHACPGHLRDTVGALIPILSLDLQLLTFNFQPSPASLPRYFLTSLLPY